MAAAVRSDDEWAGEGDEAGAPERTCVVTRAERAPEDLIRFVADPEGRVVPDVGRRLPGRGVWVTCARGVVERAIARGAFARGLKRAVTAEPALAALVDTLLARRAVEALSLANKAGLVITGFAKVDAAIATGKAMALVHGLDASADGAGKLDRRFRAVIGDAAAAPPLLPIVSVLSVAELSLAIGKPNVVHAALTKGGAANRFLREARRLERYRAPPDGTDAGHSARSRSEEA